MALRYLAVACIVMFLGGMANAAEWYLFPRHGGCLEFSAYLNNNDQPVPGKVKTPRDMLAYMRSTDMPDAEMEPLIDYEPKVKPWVKDLPPDKNSPITKKNAMVIYSKDNSRSLTLVSHELCKNHIGFAKP